MIFYRAQESYLERSWHTHTITTILIIFYITLRPHLTESHPADKPKLTKSIPASSPQICCPFTASTTISSAPQSLVVAYHFHSSPSSSHYPFCLPPRSYTNYYPFFQDITVNPLKFPSCSHLSCRCQHANVKAKH